MVHNTINQKIARFDMNTRCCGKNPVEKLVKGGLKLKTMKPIKVQIANSDKPGMASTLELKSG
jgi:hypothetical protein